MDFQRLWIQAHVQDASQILKKPVWRRVAASIPDRPCSDACICCLQKASNAGLGRTCTPPQHMLLCMLWPCNVQHDE